MYEAVKGHTETVDNKRSCVRVCSPMATMLTLSPMRGGTIRAVLNNTASHTRPMDGSQLILPDWFNGSSRSASRSRTPKNQSFRPISFAEWSEYLKRGMTTAITR